MSPIILSLILLFRLQFLNECEATPSFVSSSELFQCEYPFCADGSNCADVRCSGCTFNCFRAEKPAVCRTESMTCKMECRPGNKSKKCSACIHSKPPVPIESQCPLGTFRNITESIFSGENSTYWLDWFRPGKPAQYFSSPTMVDIDGDSVLDFFHAMHGANLLLEKGTNGRISLGSTVINKTNSEQSLLLRPVSSRIIVEDPINEDNGGYGYGMDKHGEIVADLDNDGILDIFLVSGGLKGGGGNTTLLLSRDNFLLFGEKGQDEDTGDEVTIFRGGRIQAKQAGIEGRYARGRFAYLLDVNQDGLLDIFLAQPRREDNHLAPGNLLINQGNRTWREDTSMSEFSEALILTDADGDSVAEEVMMFRGFCFPRRRDPDYDETYGPFPEFIKDYCSTRPIGSIAIYKFNHSSERMEEISPNYFNISEDKSMQPECCRHGTRESFNKGCSAVSIASADFDGDGKSDQVVLYTNKLVFFFSSDRSVGELPIEKKHIGLILDLPPLCTIGNSLQLVDMDNSGRLDIVVTCGNTATFLIYSQGEEKDSWKLNDNCHGNGSLGDIVFSTFEVTKDDILSACSLRDEFPKLNILICQPYEKDGALKPPMQNGATFADINNDGFTDIIIGNKVGYQKFFLYRPSPQSKGNKHISFRLMGDGNDVNLYGIGAHLILHALNQTSLEVYTQFREISSYQHISDKSGHQDEKVTFGLGIDLNPVKVITKWPNGLEQTLWLTQFNVSESYYHPFIDIRYPKLNEYFTIRNKKLSDSGDSLCLSGTKGGKKSKKVVLALCSDDHTLERQHFSLSQDGMIRSRNMPEYCLAHRESDKVVFLFRCKSFALNSWHSTEDGFIRLSGSNRVLGCSDVSLGGRPSLVEMNTTGNEQRWVLDKIKRIPCNEEGDNQFFLKMFKGKPIYRKCSWLNKLVERKISTICKNRDKSNDGRGPARDVCCDTCSKYAEASLR